MKKLGFLIALSLVLLAACSKEEGCAPLPATERDPRAEIVRIALEGAAMLDRDAETRAAAGRRVRLDGISCRTKPSTRAEGGTDTLYYVVNFEDGAGFALVAADDRLGDRLLAVTEQGSYTAGERSGNDGFDLYVDMLELAANIPIKDSVMMRDSTFREFDKEFEIEDYYSAWHSKTAYVPVKWGQGKAPNYSSIYPYNKYCYNQDGALCPAGCAAVATAQIMAYHKKPGSYKVTFDGSNATKTIDWEALTACVGGLWYYWPIDMADDVALLLREIGKQSNMTYDPKGSSADLQHSRFGFSAFGYDQNPGRKYTFEDVRTDLDAGRPLYMRGDTSNPGEGHAWVVDGYKYRYHYYRVYKDTENGREYYTNETTLYRYIHINWGWNGSDNGYFQDNVFKVNGAYEYDSMYDPDQNQAEYKYGLMLMTGIWNKN